MRTVNSPGGRTQPPDASSWRANARAGMASRASAARPGFAVTVAKAGGSCSVEAEFALPGAV